MSPSAASSTGFTLTVMTVVAGLAVPLLLTRQAFRPRLSEEGFGDVKSPLGQFDQKEERTDGSGPEGTGS